MTTTQTVKTWTGQTTTTAAQVATASDEDEDGIECPQHSAHSGPTRKRE